MAQVKVKSPVFSPRTSGITAVCNRALGKRPARCWAANPALPPGAAGHSSAFARKEGEHSRVGLTHGRSEQLCHSSPHGKRQVAMLVAGRGHGGTAPGGRSHHPKGRRTDRPGCGQASRRRLPRGRAGYLGSRPSTLWAQEKRSLLERGDSGVVPVMSVIT